MNPSQLANSEFYLAKWYERDWDNSKFNDGKEFRYKTYDDTQYREGGTQRQAGGSSTKHSLSIQTSCGFQFKRGDKIELVDEEVNDKFVKLTISEVERVKNTPYALNNLINSRSKVYPQRLHLNKE